MGHENSNVEALMNDVLPTIVIKPWASHPWERRKSLTASKKLAKNKPDAANADESEKNNTNGANLDETKEKRKSLTKSVFNMRRSLGGSANRGSAEVEIPCVNSGSGSGSTSLGKTVKPERKSGKGSIEVDNIFVPKPGGSTDASQFLAIPDASSKASSGEGGQEAGSKKGILRSSFSSMAASTRSNLTNLRSSFLGSRSKFEELTELRDRSSIDSSASGLDEDNGFGVTSWDLGSRRNVPAVRLQPEASDMGSRRSVLFQEPDQEQVAKLKTQAGLREGIQALFGSNDSDSHQHGESRQIPGQNPTSGLDDSDDEDMGICPQISIQQPDQGQAIGLDEDMGICPQISIQQ